MLPAASAGGHNLHDYATQYYVMNVHVDCEAEASLRLAGGS